MSAEIETAEDGKAVIRMTADIPQMVVIEAKDNVLVLLSTWQEEVAAAEESLEEN